MEKEVQMQNQTRRTLDINSPSLGNDFIDSLGNSGTIFLNTNNPPEDDFFTSMLAIVKAREEKIAQNQRMKMKYAAYAALTGTCVGFWLLLKSSF